MPLNPELISSIGLLSSAWRIFAEAVPGHWLATRPGLEIVFSGLPIAFFNMAVVNPGVRSAHQLREAARDAVAFAGEAGVPWLLVATIEALDTDVEPVATLADLDLAPAMALTGMMATTTPPLHQCPEGLDLVAAHDSLASRAMVSINSAAYAEDLAAAEQSLGSAEFWKEHHGVVGMRAGEPVACAATLVANGYRYVAFVATLPAERRKGYADAAMRRSLDLAGTAHGPLPSILHATEDGRPVYERMGYRPVSSHLLFVDRRLASGY